MSKDYSPLFYTLDIKSYLYKNLNLRAIVEIVNSEILKNNSDADTTSPYMLNKYIENILGFKYDGKLKKWIYIEPNKRPKKKQKGPKNQLSLFDKSNGFVDTSETNDSKDTSETKDTHTDTPINKKDIHKEQVTSTTSSSKVNIASKTIEPPKDIHHKIEETYSHDEIINNLNTLLKNVGNIQSNVNMLMRRTGLITPNHVIQNNHSLLMDFITKYNSSYETYCVDINIDLMNEIQTNLKTQYGIKYVGVSRFINICLFLLLFKNKD